MIARAFCYCTLCIIVIEAKTDIDFVDLYSSPEGKTMATLDEITNEKQRVSEASLARVDVSAKGSPASSLNWKQLSVCWLGITRALG